MRRALHHFFKEISDWYKIALVQLSPNGYKMAIAIYIYDVHLLWLRSSLYARVKLLLQSAPKQHWVLLSGSSEES